MRIVTSLDFFFLTSAGIDLISGVSCKTPYKWVDKTNQEWNFNFKKDAETFRVTKIFHCNYYVVVTNDCY